MTTELFKQWKRDELPNMQDYYIKNNHGQTVIARNFKYNNNKLNVLFALDTYMYKNHRREGLRCVDILSPVPSYPEIKELKKLLEKCVPYVSRSVTSRMLKNSVGYKADMKLLRQIDEVLK